MRKVYYKVVNGDMSVRRSCRPVIWRSVNGQLKYEFGEWTRPVIPNSKLFVFKDFKDAYSFEMGFPELDLEIFPCLVKNPKRILRVTALVEEIPAFWEEKRKGKMRCIFTKKAPKGAFVCDAVKLLPPKKK